MPSRRGVSEVISAVMLILITFSAGVLLYVYSSGLMAGLQVSRSATPYLDSVALEYYDWTTLNTLKLALRNTGPVNVVLADFYIAGTKNTSPLSFGSGCNSPNGALPVQSSCTITFPTPGGLSITNGLAYSVKLVATDGATFSYSCIAGQTGPS